MSDATLLVDVGNSAAKWRLLDGRDRQDGRVAYQEMDRGFQLPQHDSLCRLVVSSVSHRGGGPAFIDRVSQQFDLVAERVVSPAHGNGLINDYDNPAQLGVDRWFAAIAAWNLYFQAVVVVDCGTAMTLDLVDGQGHFRGGMIFPGLETLRDVFLRHAPHLGEVNARDGSFPPRNTADAIGQGAWLGSIAIVEKFVQNAGATLGYEPRVILSGGNASRLADSLTLSAEVKPDLVLDGLEIYAAS